MKCCPVLVFLLVVFSVQLSRAAPGAKRSPIRVPSQCPRIFGNKLTRAANGADRVRFLHWVFEEAEGITIAHSHGSWTDPIRLRLAGIEVVDRTPYDPKTAIVHINSEIAEEIGCPAGDYRVRRDDSLGHNAHVLAVFRDLLLVEHQGMLTYMAPKETQGPRWVCGWTIRGRYRVQVPATGSQPRTSSAPAPRKQVLKKPARVPSIQPRVVH